MKDTRKKLIVELRKNARSKLTEMSENADVPVSTIFDQIRSLEKEELIEHKALVNFEKLGFNTRVFMAMKTETNNREKLEDHLKRNKNVNSIFQINSGYDFLIDAVFRNQKELQCFVDELEFKRLVTGTNTLNVIDVISKEKFLTEESHFI